MHCGETFALVDERLNRAGPEPQCAIFHPNERQLWLFAGAMIPHPILAYIQPSPDILDGKQRIVLDNGHRVSDDVLAETVRSMGAARWVVLAQEWPGRELFATATGARAEVLAGWSRDSIASVAAAIGCFGSMRIIKACMI
jgi:hypothetical protein